MKTWLLFLAFLFLGGCAPMAQVAPAKAVVLSRIEPRQQALSVKSPGAYVLQTQVGRMGASVHAWCEEHNTHHLIGSAVYAGRINGKTYFYTAAHVVKNDLQGEWNLVPSLGGIGATARVAMANEDADVAILVVDGIAEGWWGEGAQLAQTGRDYAFEPCVAYGHPDGLKLGHPSFGLVAGPIFERRWQFSAPIFFGNSGGGVYVWWDGAWRLLGVAQQIRGNQRGLATHAGMASSTEALAAALKLALDVAAAEEVK